VLTFGQRKGRLTVPACCHTYVGSTRTRQEAGLISLTVPGLLAYRDIAMRTVSGTCKLVGSLTGSKRATDDAFIHEFVSAFGEAFNNVVLHSYAGVDPPGALQIDIAWDSEAITACLTDRGRSFEPGMVPSPDLDSLPESGMGLFIIRSFVDRIEYVAGPPNIVRLTKLLRPAKSNSRG
jgi:serine/threonine-protein kinase RsbW